MKLRKLTLAAGLLAALGMSGQATALPITTTPDFVFNISGASAQQNPLNQLLTSFCQAGTLTSYRSATLSTNWRSFYCTIDQSQNPTIIPASLDGANVLFNTRSAGGSIWGVVPVARQWGVEYMNIFTSCPVAASGTVNCPITTRATGLDPFAAGTGGLECPFTPFVPGTDLYVTTTNGDLFAQDGTTAEQTVCLRSTGGVSDVEPALFSSLQNFPGFAGGPLSAAEIGSMTVLSEYGVIFGVSINDRIYRQLQEAQGLATYTDALNPPALQTGPDGTDLSDTARPSLPLTAIRSLLNGSVGSFGALDASLNELTPGIMAVCRRVVGSGTQAANNVFNLGVPCLGAAATNMVSDPDGGGPGQFIGSQYVQNNSGSSDVENCHTDAQDGALDPGTSFGLPMDSIGFNAINRTLDPDEDWRFVKIDGVDPTVANAIAGKYNHVFEQTLQYPNSNTPVQVDAMRMVAIASGDPTTIATTPINGVMALPINGFDWQVDPQTWRGGRGGNSCSPVVLEPEI